MAARDRSPFPGMDPYFEPYWGDIHNKLITFAAGALNVVLPGDLVARAELRVTLGPDDGDGETFGRTIAVESAVPDVRVEPLGPAGAGGAAVASGPRRRTAVLAIPMPRTGPVRRRWIEVKEIDGDRIVTSLEFLSPTNKRGEGRRQFLRKRRRMLGRGVNCVEVDLTRGGDPRRLVPAGFLLPPAGRRATYRAMTFVPSADDVGAWVYPMPLRRPLPDLPIPLRPGEESATLPLQPLIDQAYREGRYARSLGYDRPPDPPLSPDDAAWAAGLDGVAAA